MNDDPMNDSVGFFRWAKVSKSLDGEVIVTVVALWVCCV